uniref:Uncharacterized protein LOC111104738 isoform X2 n=1 Tax=Crassostrea virginica TaxID=6565 RepID=A0A8B8AV35_CRAVI|nr:uncharacterized protein LOC111104738 isoform X2 [Crassostrea virginica]
MNVIRFIVALWIVTVVNATTNLKIDESNCDGPQKTVIDDAWNKQNITSHCNCTIKINFSGQLMIRSDNTCSPGFYVFDDKRRFNETICNHNKAHFSKQVTKGDKLTLVLMNTSLIQPDNPGNIVEIYASLPGSGLFSVTCGAASDSVTRTTRPTFVTGTNKDWTVFFMMVGQTRFR